MSPPRARRPLSRTGRIVAGVLAAIWIIVGIGAAVLGVRQGRVGAILLGAVGVAYGLVWLGVARTGHYALWPLWRKRG
ncbi:MAG: hypothetical protein H0U85_08630 [Gemmatimonadales bacterium]|nr:hypothetical protein [Gemmatimonadales bacterium]